MTLSEYLIAYLGKLALTLEWDEADLDIVVTDTIEDYGISTEAEATDIKKLRLLGKVNLWKKVLTETSGDYNFSSDGGSFSRSQFYDMALKNYEIACNDALEYLPNYQIKVTDLSFANDPYQWSE